MRLMKKFQLKQQIIAVHLTAEDWDLLLAKEDVDKVATRLNDTLKSCINKGYTRSETVATMGHTMRTYSRYGCNDTEPRKVLDQLLNEFYKVS